jgi:polar amino acid transport system substrate-binding protein
MRLHLGLRPLSGFAGACALIATIASAATAGAQAIDPVALAQLAPTGKLRVGVAAGLTPGTGTWRSRPERHGPRASVPISVRALGTRLGMAVEWVTYPNSGALTEAATTGAWDVAFMPVDEQRKQKLDFGAAHIVLESTWMVGPGSPIRMLADVDRPGTRVVGVENTASARAAQRYLKNVTVGLVTGKVDVTGGSRESLVVLAALLPGSRVLDGAYLNCRGCRAEGPAGRPGLCQCLRGRGQGVRPGAPLARQFRHAKRGDRPSRDNALRLGAYAQPPRLKPRFRIRKRAVPAQFFPRPRLEVRFAQIRNRQGRLSARFCGTPHW